MSPNLTTNIYSPTWEVPKRCSSGKNILDPPTNSLTSFMNIESHNLIIYVTLVYLYEAIAGDIASNKRKTYRKLNVSKTRAKPCKGL